MYNQLLVKGFDTIEYVTNPYTLCAFVFIVAIVGISVMAFSLRVKAVLLVICAGLSLTAGYMLLATTLTNIEEQLLVHVVKDGGRSLVAPGIEIELADIETLKGKKSWAFNIALDDTDHVFHEVFARAGVDLDGSVKLAEMTDSRWADFIRSLEDAGDVQQQLQAEKIKDIPFAKFRVFIDGTEDDAFLDQYFFKNERLYIPRGSPDSARVELEVANIYNTKHHTSGEREAVNIRVLRNKR